MALKATIYKLELSIADMDRNYYETHNLTIARHPSETDERMMVRIMAFALNAHERLQFTKGLSTEDEPDLWQKSLSDEIELWIDLGMPSEKRIRQGSNKSMKSMVYCYGGRTVQPWWDKMSKMVFRFDNLSVFYIEDQYTQALEKMAERSMQLQVNIQDGEVMVTNGTDSVDFKPMKLA